MAAADPAAPLRSGVPPRARGRFALRILTLPLWLLAVADAPGPAPEEAIEFELRSADLFEVGADGLERRALEVAGPGGPRPLDELDGFRLRLELVPEPGLAPDGSPSAASLRVVDGPWPDVLAGAAPRPITCAADPEHPAPPRCPGRLALRAQAWDGGEDAQLEPPLPFDPVPGEARPGDARLRLRLGPDDPDLAGPEWWLGTGALGPDPAAPRGRALDPASGEWILVGWLRDPAREAPLAAQFVLRALPGTSGDTLAERLRRLGLESAAVTAAPDPLTQDRVDSATQDWWSWLGGVLDGALSAASATSDDDGDGASDDVDNCLGVPNPLQRDTDGDGFGNRCDADLDQDGSVDFADLAALAAAIGSADPDADLDGDGDVDAQDLDLAKTLRFRAPGPSALVPVGLDPTRFVLLDASGLPVEGSLVNADGSGALPPFEYRPAGRSLLGAGQGLGIRFPQGATLIGEEGEQRLRFSEATAQFGSRHALQLAPALAWTGAARELPLGPLDAATLAAAFGLDPAPGIALRLFRIVPLRWQGGVLEADGVRDPDFSFDKSVIPFPLDADAYEDIDFSPIDDRGESDEDAEAEEDGLFDTLVAFATSGEIEIPDGSDNSPTLRVSSKNPAWIEFSEDGEIAFQGRAELIFPDGGPRFHVDLRGQDPNWQLTLAGRRVQIEALGSLADLLPMDPRACVADTPPTEVQLELAEQCLRSFGRAYGNFSASAGASSDGDIAPLHPGSPVATHTSVLEAWGFAALSEAGTQLPLDDVQDLLLQLRGSGTATPDLPGVLRYRRAVVRALAAIEEGKASASPETQAELEAALAELDAAAIARADETAAGDQPGVTSMDDMRRGVRLLLDTQVLRARADLPQSAELYDAMTRLYARVTAAHLRELGVVAGAYTSAANPTIADMDRFHAFQELRELIEIRTDTALLSTDFEQALDAPLDEAAAQLALRLAELATATLASALADADVNAYQYALADLAELVALKQLAAFPPASAAPPLATLPDIVDLNDGVVALGTLYELELAKPYGERLLGNQAAQIRVLLRILRSIPGDVSFASGPIQRALDELGESLATAMARLSITSSLLDLVELLEAGFLRDALAERFEIALGDDDWKTVRLPLVVARIAERAREADAWAALQRAAGALQREADRRGRDGDFGARLACLEHVATLQEAARDVAVALWNREQAARDLGLVAEAVDLVLPGDIVVSEAFGALRVNRNVPFLKGSVGGTLKLPKFDAGLTIESASLTSGGAFALSAHGAIAVPSDDPVATLSIPPRRPLQLRWSPSAGLAVLGGGRAQLSNGMYFESFLVVDDPLYGFGIEAGGLRLELADKLRLAAPDLPDGLTLDRDEALALARYFDGINRTLEGLSVESLVPKLGDAGTPPRYRRPAGTLPSDPISAWAASVLADQARGLVNDYAPTGEALAAALRQVRDDANGAAAQLEDLERLQRTLIALQDAHAALTAIEQSAVLGEDPLAEDQAAFDAAADEVCQKIRELALSPRTAQSHWRTVKVIRMSQACSVLQTEDGPDIFADLAVLGSAYRANRFAALGLDPDTGNVADAAIFEALSIAELERAFGELAEVSELEAVLTTEGDNLPILLQAWQHVYVRYRALALEELRELPEFRVNRRIALLRKLADMAAAGEGGLIPWPATLEQLDGSFASVAPLDDVTGFILPALEPLLEARDVDLAARRANPIAGLAGGFVDLLDRVDGGLALDVEQRLTDEVLERLDELIEYAAEPWPADRVRDGAAALRELAALAAWLERVGHPDAARVHVEAIPALTAQLVAAAELNRAWWVLAEYTDTLLVQVADGASAFDSAVLDAAADSLRAQQRVRDQLVSSVFDAIPPQLDLSLPGDLVVRRVFGQLFYDRQLALLTGSFGGRLEFPEIDAFFSIDSATVASSGDLAIAASTAGPLPFDGAALEASISVAYDAPLPIETGLTVLGTGTLSLDTGEALAVDVSYLPATRLLSVDGALENAEIRFGDDLVFFDLSAGFDLDTQSPAGRLRLGGSAGIWADDLLPPQDPDGQTVVSRADFQIFVENVLLEAALDTSSFELQLTQGDLHLPDFMQTADLCAPDPGDPPGTVDGPNLSLTPGRPLRLSVTRPAAAGDPWQISTVGSLALRNIGFEVPDFGGLQVELCRADLSIASPSPPRLENVTGELALDLDDDETLLVGLDDAEWDLAGYPTGRVSLLEDLTVFESDGFEVRVIGGDPDPGGQTCTVPATETCLGTEYSGTGLAICRGAGGLPRFELDGGVEVSVPPTMLALDDPPDGDATLAIASCGGIALDADPCAVPQGVCPGFCAGACDPAAALPELSLRTLAASGNFRLGGSDGGGVLVSDASLEINEIDQLFSTTAPVRLELVLSGNVALADGGPGAGLTDARFRLTQTGATFQIGGFTLVPGETPLFDGFDSFSVDVTEAGVQFVDPNRPLVALIDPELPPTPDNLEPSLLAPDNLELILSGNASIGFPDDAGIGGLSAAVENLVAVYDPTTKLMVIDVTRLEGLGFGIQDVNVPPMQLSGTMYLGGLENPPASLYVAGKLGGKYNGTGVRVDAAFSVRDGPIGACLDVSGGTTGIPLGPSGFLLTGVRGGVVFPPDPSQEFTDPCGFVNDFFTGGRPNSQPPETGAPAPARVRTHAKDWRQRAPAALSWSEFAVLRDRQQREERRTVAAYERALLKQDPLGETPANGDFEGALLAASSGDELQFGPCPPPTITLTCQPHPNTGQEHPATHGDGPFVDPELFARRVILKFSSFEREQVLDLLDGAGIDADFLAQLGDAALIGDAVAGALRQTIEGLWPVPLEGTEAIIAQVLDEAEVTLAFLISSSVENVQGGPNLLEAVVNAAYAGIPCPQITMKLEGTFSYQGVSAFASVTGGATLSGGALTQDVSGVGLQGSVNLMSIPVGTAQAFFAYTDANGNPNPSLCGKVRLGVGPAQFGELDASLTCTDCLTGQLVAMANLGQCLTPDNASGRAALCRAIHRATTAVDSALLGEPDDDFDPTCDAPALLADALGDTAIPEAQRVETGIQIVGDLFRNSAAELGAALPGCFAGLLGDSFDAFQPRLGVGGQAQVTLFGFPVSPELAEVALLLEKGATGEIELVGQFGFSATELLRAMNSVFALIPVTDFGTAGFALQYPNPLAGLQVGLGGGFEDPDLLAQYVADATNDFLDRGIYTLSYSLSPFGVPMLPAQDGVGLAQLEGRLIAPDLLAHPAFTGFAADADPNLPTRRELLLRMIAQPGQFLANPFWRGDEEDLRDLYDPADPEYAALAGRSLRRDFFPHGGTLGAGILRMPRLLTDAPDTELIGKILGEATDPVERFTSITQFVNDYILGPEALRVAGELALYVPAPNPPDPGGLPCVSDPDPFCRTRLWDSILEFDATQFPGGDFGPLYPLEFAFLEGDYTGTLLGMKFAEASIVAAPPASLEISATLPDACPYDVPGSDNWLSCFLPNTTFLVSVEQPQGVQGLLIDELTVVADLLAAGQVDVAYDRLALELRTRLPRASVEFDTDFQIPPPLAPYLSGGTDATLFAYSAGYDPDAAGDGARARAQRYGGVGAQGLFTIGAPGLGPLVTIDNAELSLTSGPGGLPRITANLEAPALPVLPGLSLVDVRFDFDTAAAVGENVLAGSGGLPPFNLSLDGSACDPATDPLCASLTRADGAAGPIGSSFRIERGASAPAVSLEVDPARLALNLFGSGLSATVHGGREAGSGTLLPFTLTNDPAQTWSAEIDVRSDLLIGASGLPPALRISTPTCVGASADCVANEFRGQLTGRGLQLDSLGIAVPLASEVTLFPGTPQAQTFRLCDLSTPGDCAGPSAGLTITSDGSFTLTLRSAQIGFPSHFELDAGDLTLRGEFVDGSYVLRFEADDPGITLFPGQPFQAGPFSPCGQLEIDSRGFFLCTQEFGAAGALALPGPLSAQGRLEIGFSPDDSVPGILVARNVGFGDVPVGTVATRTLTIQNTGAATLSAYVQPPKGSLFTIQPTTLLVPPFASADSTIYFQPTVAGTKLGTLTILHDVPGVAPIDVFLAGNAVGQPELSASTSALDLGAVLVGDSRRRHLTVSNVGDADLVIDAADTSAPFRLEPFLVPGGTLAFPRTLAGGESWTFSVVFEPGAAGIATGEITFGTNAATPAAAIGLSGIGQQQTWYTQLSGHGTPAGVTFNADRSRGIAVASFGQVWISDDAGRSWLERRIEGEPQLRDVALERVGQRAWAAGSDALYETVDGGRSWAALALPLVPETVTLAAPDTPIAAGLRGAAPAILYEGASGWTFADIPPASGPVVGLHIAWQDRGTTIPNARGCAVGEDFVWISFDSGERWSDARLDPGLLGTAELEDCAVRPDGVAVAVGSQGLVLLSNDGGQRWERVDVGGSASTTWATAEMVDNVIWIGGSAGALRFSADAGRRWSAESGPVGFITDLFALAGDLYASGSFDNIAHRPASGVDGPILSAQPAEVDFGTLVPNQIAARTLTLFNRGTGTLRDVKIDLASSGPYVIAQSDGVDIPAGTSVAIDLFYTPTAASDRDDRGYDVTAANAAGVDGRFLGETVASTWIEVTVPGTALLYALDFPSDDVGYALADQNQASAGGDRLLKTVDGGLNWAPVTALDPFIAAGTHLYEIAFADEQRGYVAAGSFAFSSCSGGGDDCKSQILVTEDGGATWSAIPTGTTLRVTDVAADGPDAIVGTVGPSGNVLTWLDDLWTTRARPVSDFSSGGVAMWRPDLSPPGVLAASGPELFHNVLVANGQDAWSRVYDTRGADINDVDAAWARDAVFVVAVDDDGQIHASLGSEPGPPWRVLQLDAATLEDVHVVDDRLAFVSGDGKVFRSADGGTTWTAETLPDPAAGSSVNDIQVFDVFARSATRVWAAGKARGGFSDPGTLWRLQDGPLAPQSFGSLPASQSFGTTTQGTPVTLGIPLRNVGTAPLAITDVNIVGLHASEFQVAGALPDPLAPGAMAVVPVEFGALAAGDKQATLRVITDGQVGTLFTELSGEVLAPEAGLLITSFPAGVEILIDGVAQATPIALYDRAPGSFVQISAPLTYTIGSLEFSFGSWSHGAAATHTLQVQPGTTALTASYFASPAPPPLLPGVAAPAAKGGAPAAATAADELPSGPFLRLGGLGGSGNARLRVAALGVDLPIEGRVLLSSDEIFALLQSGDLRIPAATGAVLDVGAASWVLDYQRDERLRISAGAPAVSVLGRTLPGAGALDLDFDIAGGSLDTTLTADGTWTLAPQILALGPQANTPLTFSFDAQLGAGSVTSLELGILGRLHALRTPSSTWLFERNVFVQTGTCVPPACDWSYTLAPEQISCSARLGIPGAFTLGKDGTAATCAGASSQVSVGWNGSLATVELSDFALDVLGQRLGHFDASLSGTSLSLAAAASNTGTLSVAGIDLDLDGADANLDLDLATTPPTLAVGLDEISVSISEDLWAAQPTFTFPSISFNSNGSFSKTVTPTEVLSFLGVEIDPDIGDSASLDLLRTSNGTVYVDLRGGTDFLGNDFDFELGLRSVAPQVSARIQTGTFSVDHGGVLIGMDNPLELGALTLTAGSCVAYPFQGFIDVPGTSLRAGLFVASNSIQTAICEVDDDDAIMRYLGVANCFPALLDPESACP